jgi:hypothetical protein
VQTEPVITQILEKMMCSRARKQSGFLDLCDASPSPFPNTQTTEHDDPSTAIFNKQDEDLHASYLPYNSEWGSFVLCSPLLLFAAKARLATAGLLKTKFHP